jgi:hypothetical protein
MNMKWISIVLVASLAVAGCTGPKETAAQRLERIHAELKGMQPAGDGSTHHSGHWRQRTIPGEDEGNRGHATEWHEDNC